MTNDKIKLPTVTPGNAQHVGARSEQQDAFGFSAFDDAEFVEHAGVLAIVADGMGGMAMGREASAIAVRTFLTSYAAKEKQEKIAAVMVRGLHAANRAVNRKAAEAGVEGEAGTTLVAVVIHEGMLYRIAAGDSRIYLFRESVLRQLTTDYNYGRVLDRMAEDGEMSRSEAAAHPSRAALTSYLGKAEVDEYDSPTDAPLALQPGDKILLASDGLFGFLDETEIAMLMAQTPQHAAENLIEATLKQQHPYQDNVTVAILGYELPPPPPLAETQLRKAEPAKTVAEKPRQKKKPAGTVLKIGVLLLVLAVAAFWGGRYYFENSMREPTSENLTDKAEPKPIEKSLEKPLNKSSEKPPEKSAENPAERKDAQGANKPKSQ